MDAELVDIKKSEYCYTLKIKCPYCSKVHSHGGGPSKDAPILGHRGSHCGVLGGYNIVVPENMTDKYNSVVR